MRSMRSSQRFDLRATDSGRLVAPACRSWRLAVFYFLVAPLAIQAQTLSIRNVVFDEGDVGTTLAIFEVTVTGTFYDPVFVNYRTVDGTATVADGDYQRAGGQLVFVLEAPNSLQVEVPILGDRRAELNENFFVVLYNAQGATISRGRGRGTILNDDPAILSIDDVKLKEGNDGTKKARFKVTAAGEFSRPLTVEYQTADGTATVSDGDYETVEGTLNFPPGQPEQWIEVPIVGDTKSEPDETFYVNLSNPFRAEIEDGQGRGTIWDDDELPVLSIDDVTLFEGDSGTSEAVFTVTLSGKFSEPVMVDVNTVDGTAMVGDSDYSPFSTTLTFGTGDSLTQKISAPVPVLIVGDAKAEPDEYFFVQLSDPIGASIMDGEGVGTIQNDDLLPTLSISDTSVKEGTGPAIFTVTLNGEFSEEVVVSYETVDGSAMVADGDYQQKSDQLPFPPDNSTTRSQEVEIQVNNDDFFEPNETFSVRLFEAVGADIKDEEGTATIYDRDPPLTLSISDGSIVEGDSGNRSLDLTVTLTGALEETVTVTYETIDGKATAADGDYVPVFAKPFKFQKDGLTSRSRELPIEIVGDTRVEGDEMFSVKLSTPDFVDCKRCQGFVTIEDDDEESRLQWTASSVVENAGMAVVTIERIGAGSESASVTVTADSGTATVGQDFTATTRVLKWEPRQTGRQSIKVPILDDNVHEGDESLVLRLSEVEGAEPGSSTELELVIIDDDKPMQLEIDGDPDPKVGSNERLELKVRAVREDGQAVQGLQVAWRVAGDGELLDGEVTLTDVEGFARQRVQVGAKPGTVTVTAEILSIDSSVTFQVEIQGGLAILPGLSNPGQRSVARVLDESCTTASGDFEVLCDYVFALEDEDDQVDTVVELTPEEVAAQGTVSQSSPLAQLGNISARLAALRDSTKGSVLGNFAFSLRGIPLGVGQIRESWASRGEEAEWLSGALDRALVAQEEPDRRREGRHDLGAAPGLGGGEAESRWGFFLSGRIAAGDRPDSERESGFDFETLGVTAGVDYRFSPRLVGGFALGYLDTETEISNDGGQLEAQGYSISTFGMFYAGDFFVEGMLSYGRNDYDQARNVDLPQPFQDQSRFVARSRADSDQLSLGLQLGYELAFGAASLAGTAGLVWVDAEIDSFLEQGAGPLNLRIEGQAVESLQSQARLDWRRAISVRSWNVVLHPTFSFAYLHEFEDDSRPIRGSFAEDPTGNTFEVPTEPPDRDFFRVAAGFTMAFAHGRSVFLLYEQDLDRQDLDAYAISFGLRLGL